jgi:hypothetical protein
MKANILLSIVLVSVSGCGTVPGLSPEHKNEIHTIAISSKLEGTIYYQKFGSTVFQNSDQQPIDDQTIAETLQVIEQDLKSRGYNIASSGADAVLEITPYRPDLPYTATMFGPGLSAHKTFAFNTGVRIYLSVCMNLKSPNLRRSFVSRCLGGTGIETGVMDVVDDWQEYPEDVRNAMLDQFRRELLGRAVQTLDDMGM